MSIPPYPKGDIGRLVKRHLREGDVALDVGACKGEITQFMLKAVGASGRVIAVEPDRRSVADLQELYPQLTLIGAAAWSSACELTIYRNQHPDQSSLFHELVRDWSEKGAVPAISLDEVTENIRRWRW
jgi:FkbM family methyltransferase